MRNLYRGPAKDASYQVSIHLAKRFQRRRFFQKSTNQKQELLMVAMFVNGSGQNEQSFQREPSIDASYQVSLHLAEGFQRRRLKCEKVTDDRQRTPSHGKSSRCLWQGELKIYCPPRDGFVLWKFKIYLYFQFAYTFFFHSNRQLGLWCLMPLATIFQV